MRNHDYWVYILTNKHCTTLYIGITNDIVRRLYQHRFGEVKGFLEALSSKPAGLDRTLSLWTDAIACEKKLKGWRRCRKIALIERKNPRWIDLSDDWEQQPKIIDRALKITEMI
jgi:putative endonuclease